MAESPPGAKLPCLLPLTPITPEELELPADCWDALLGGRAACVIFTDRPPRCAGDAAPDTKDCGR